MNIVALRLNNQLEVEKRLIDCPPDSVGEQTEPSLPFHFYDLDFASYLEDALPWHWQQDAEIIEVTAGTLDVRSSKNSYILNVGDFCFINPRMLHQILPALPGASCALRTVLFKPDFISGGWGSVLDTHYVSPLLDCHELDLLPFYAGHEQTPALACALHTAGEKAGKKGFAYELDVRTQLTEVWKILCRAAAPRLNERSHTDDRSEERMAAMLTFIQENYMEKIGLSEIAEAATISERECFRCFQKTLKVTPIHYLQNYRVRMAARRLLETDDTVLSICQSVGFTDNSYFGRIFRKYLHCSPSQFRRNRHRLGQG